MKTFYFFIVIFSLFAKVAAKCADSCECPAFPSLRVPPVETIFQFTQLAGCTANATCVSPSISGLVSGFTFSQIPMPTDAMDDYFEIISSFPDNEQSSPTESDELFSLFGIICEGGSWYATKYPKGIKYLVDGSPNSRYTNFTESYEGLKSMIGAFAWSLKVNVHVIGKYGKIDVQKINKNVDLSLLGGPYSYRGSSVRGISWDIFLYSSKRSQ